ncbi:flagellar hook protein FlgE [Sphingomonas sp. RIT328]|uniref:flagellar hook protein FlgE n=1 Tax=Sphingomonas sp. RIT328 TaxID=1470591 RepID=UPI0004501C1A|nr:flagellar hook protein FlgE [Sphingomonas sp. RIT328]EZP48685.1 Flagellar hook-basal body s family protein [Sphingomonas sp. RIT328]
MGLYSAMSAGVSGLNAQSAAMSTVADNITNVNTVGYKATSAEFKTMVGGGSTGGDYSAGGVNTVTHARISYAGVPQPTNSNSDLAIGGNGFFVVGADASSNVIAYTRAGSFSKDKNGFLQNTAGYYLLGWPTDSKGQYVNTGTTKDLQPINYEKLSGAALPSTKLTFRANLQSTTPAFTGTYAAGNLATGTVAPNFSSPVSVYDAQGGAHQLRLAFLKTAPNSWKAEIYAVPASDVSAANGLLASGDVKFNGDGTLDRANSSPALFADLSPAWTNGAGTAPITMALGSDGKLDGLTQSSDASLLTFSGADGGLMGTVTDVNVSETGLVSAVFENGTMRPIYQLPLATFANPDGLAALQGNAYQVSDKSGTAAINPVGAHSGSKIASKMVEGSTADLANEFTNMIRFQRAYSASSKIITTVDQMLQELSEMKR